jgi:hypothetical protein
VIRRAYLPFGILALAAGLRFWALGQGLPFLMARPDEREAFLRMAGFPQGDLNPHWFVYPNLFFWTIWLWDEALLALRRLWLATPDFGTLLANDMSWLILYGRILSALTGVATVALTHRVGRRVGGSFVAAAAALVVATNLLHVRDSHAMKTETFHALGILATLVCLAAWMRTRRTRFAVAAGVVIGLTTAFRYTGVLLVLPAWLADLRMRRGEGMRALVPSRGLLAVGAVAALVFFMGSPYLILDYANAQREAAFYGQVVYSTRAQDAGPTSIADAVRWLVRTRAFGHHVTVSLRHGCGLAMTVAALPAVVMGFRSADPFLWLAAAYTTIHYLVTGASPLQLSRYFTPIVPLLALLVAAALARATAAIRSARTRDLVRVAATVLLVAEPTYGCLKYDRIASETDTRVLATAWMAEHLPQGAVVARLGSFIYPIADPELPAGVVDGGLPWGATDIDARGITYVVTQQHVLPFSKLVPQQWNVIAPRLKLLAEFMPFHGRASEGFEALDAYYVPLWDFGPMIRPGPIVRIWAVRPAS